MILKDVQVGSHGVALSGTLAVPETPKGIVVFVHGSGPMDRDQNTPNARLNTFATLADAVGAAGYASLRWDKRGVGKSGGDYLTLGQGDLVADVATMIAFARAQGLGPVICCGHSEGTQLAPEAASIEPVDGHILICPYITSGHDILVQQSKRLDSEIASMTGWRGVLARSSARVFGPPSRQQDRFLRRLAKSQGDTIRIGFRKVPARWLRDFVTADLPAIHASNKAPTLVISAQYDAQCPPQDGARITALNPLATHVMIDRLSHILRETDGPKIADYPRQLQQPTNSHVAETIRDWLARVFDPNLTFDQTN